MRKALSLLLSIFLAFGVVFLLSCMIHPSYADLVAAPQGVVAPAGPSVAGSVAQAAEAVALPLFEKLAQGQGLLAGAARVVAFLLNHGQDLVDALFVFLNSLIAVFLFVPGPHPEKELHALADFVGKFSRKPKPPEPAQGLDPGSQDSKSPG